MPPEDNEEQASSAMRWHNNNESTNSADPDPQGTVTTDESQGQQEPATPTLPEDDVVVPHRPAAQLFGQREQSAEEIMEASLSFRHQSLSSPSRWLGSNSELYPNPTSVIETGVLDEIAALPNVNPTVRVNVNSHGQIPAHTGMAEVEQIVVDVDGEAVRPYEATTAAIEEPGPVVTFASLNNNHAFATEEASVTLDDEAELIAYKRAAAGYSRGVGPSSWSALGNNNVDAFSALSDQEAVVVDITEHDVHPSDLSHNDARAELIGQDYSRSLEMPSTPGIAFDESYVSSYQATPNDMGVLDGRAMINEDESSAWNSPYSGDTYVFDNSSANSLERKRPADHNDHNHDPWARNLEQDAGFVLAEEEAEVVGITENVHPSEISGESVAEFIGSNFNVAMAVRPETMEDSSDGRAVSTEHATVVEVTDENNFDHDMIEDEGIESGVAESDYSSAVALPMLPGTPFDREQQHISEAQVLPSYNAPSDDYPSKPPATPRDAVANMEQSGRASVTFSEWPLVPSQTVQDNFVIVSSGDFDDVSCGVARAHKREENVEGTPLPQPSSFNSQRDASASTARSDGSRTSLQTLSNNIARSTNTVIEKLFGDTPPVCRRPNFEVGDAGGNIHPRTLLPWSVFRNEANGMWVVTLNTNQKALDSNNVTEASKALKAFSVPTEKQAMSLARSWAPPRMLPFQDNPSCSTCETRFAVFRRACHCRNCGVCICSRCAIQWPSKMIPETYNIKKESIVNICKACDWLCTGFRLALLESDFDRAVALHATGNINLVTPFANVKGELFYPVHCAVLGGNLQLLKWLVDENCCPLRSIRISGKNRDPLNSFTPILTSRGRSLLSISMEMKHVPIIRYLVVDKGMSISAERNVTVDTITQTLTLVLQLVPHNIHEQHSPGETGDPEIAFSSGNQSNIRALSESPISHPNPQPISLIPPPEVSAQHLEAIYGCGGFVDDEPSADDMCIICFSKRIDCVITPCGHQICCLQCSNNISRCPVCSVDCSFMRVFKA